MTFPILPAPRARARRSPSSSASGSASCSSAPASGARNKLVGAVLRTRHDRLQGHVQRHRHRHARRRARLRARARGFPARSPTTRRARTFLVPMIAAAASCSAPASSSRATARERPSWRWRPASSTGSSTVLGVVVGQVHLGGARVAPRRSRRSTTRAASATSTSGSCSRLPASSGPYIVARRRDRHGRRLLRRRGEARARARRGRADPLRRRDARAGGPGASCSPASPPPRRVGLVGLALPTGTQAAARERDRPSRRSRSPGACSTSPGRSACSTSAPLAACSAKRVPGAECVPAEKLGEARARATPDRRATSCSSRATPLAALPAAAAALPRAACSRSRAAGRPGRRSRSLRRRRPPPARPAAELEAYRLRAGIHAAMTGMKAAPPPPAPTAAPGAPRKAGGGGCSG